MAGASGPDLVQNGLVLALDASDRNSYPGSGTTWRDMSGNSNNGTLTNGPTFNSANGGSIVFDGSDDYAQITTSGIINNIISVDTMIYIDSVKTYAAILGSNITEKYEMLIKHIKIIKFILNIIKHTNKLINKYQY